MPRSWSRTARCTPARLRSALATDTYILADDAEVDLEPAFTFHGFRYAEVSGDIELLDAAVVAISSVGTSRGRFTSSEPLLERLHENVLWSLRDNFVSVPTDCPQRDERLGWTGDAQAFASTASVLVDCRAFWMSWLRDLALEQDPVLGVATVVPDVVLTGDARFGRAGWADAAAIVPWAVYEAYGDREVLRQQLPSMRAHVDSLDARRAPDGLLPESMQFGDWLDPDAPSHRPWLAKADSRYIANAYPRPQCAADRGRRAAAGRTRGRRALRRSLASWSPVAPGRRGRITR